MAEGWGGAIRLAYYGDDFTGSTDTLAAAVGAGWRAALFLDVPSAADLEHFGPLDCVGVAGTARSMSPADMDSALPRVFAGLAATGAAVVHYKTCSTFDSAPHIGSIGHAVRLAWSVLGRRPAYIVGGQPNLGRYCAYANLYARAGQTGTVYRIDRHPTMRQHPVTPMDEADLREHLGRQGLAPVVSFDAEMLEMPADARAARLPAMMRSDVDAVLFDVVREGHLPVIGELLWSRCDKQGPLLAVGPTGVVQALLAARPPALQPRVLAPQRAVPQTFIVAGSRSPVTGEQIRTAEQDGFASVQIDPAALAVEEDENPAVNEAATPGGGYTAELADRVARLLKEGRSVVAHSTFADDSLGARPGFTKALAIGCGRLMARVLERHPLARVGLAGGDTSSLAVQSWGVRALTMSYLLSPGVAVCRVHAPGLALDGIELMLKGGQMGPPGLFAALLHGER
jgi:uncharacterized protein YgbK (DUF1537 family)